MGRNRNNRNHKIDHEPFIVAPDTEVDLADLDCSSSGGFSNKKAARKALLQDVGALAEAQELLWASSRHAVLVILQAMDAAGKDGAIKHVMSGVNPQGVEVRSFKAPTDDERKHHFLWRPQRVIPARGRIGIFNRSYYEEVLVVRVHPSFLEDQWLPRRERHLPLDELWRSRYRDINDFESRLVRDDVCVIKFFLHLSYAEQRKRFLARLNEPEKHYKFSIGDLREREHWDDYQRAYEEMLSATSTADAPWYIVPADRKWFARALIADVIAARIRNLNLQLPELTDEQRGALDDARAELT